MYIFLAYFAIALTSEAQVPRVSKYLPSMDAASLGEYGDIPMSLYTGRAQVSIPLVTLEDGDHSIPITLDYLGGGIKVEQMPGYMGMGWVLNVPGCITRQVRGKYQDECRPRYEGESYEKGGKYGYYYIDKNVKNFSAWNYRPGMLNQIYDRAKNHSDTLDLEPDRFSFSFPGGHGNFYLNENGQWMVQCNKEVKVEFDWDNPDNFTRIFNRKKDYGDCYNMNFKTPPVMTAIARSDNIKGFTLIDDDGTRYTYGKDENAIEFSIPVVNQMNSGVVATAWYLTKIEYIDGKCATFRYKRVEYDFQLQLTDATEYSSIGNKQAYFGVSSGEYGGSLIFPVYPSSFSFGGCTLSFSFDGTSSNKRQLQPDYYHAFDKNLGIKHFPVLSDALNDDGNRFSNSQAIDSLVAVRPLRRILFGGNKGTYNWEFEYSNNSSQRLTLQKMKAAAYNGHPNEEECVYTFEYISPERLPQYHTRQFDKWGYYNGFTANIYFPDTRPVNPQLAAYGSLSKIVYPTGGYTRFEYEGNCYSKQVSDDRRILKNNSEDSIGGGIRVKSIFNSPTGKSADEFLYRSFEYSDNGRSTGELLQPVRCHVVNNAVTNQYGDLYTMDSRSLYSVIAFDVNIQAAPVGYSKVKEIFPDGCYRWHYFTNYSTGHKDLPATHNLHSHSVYTPYTSLDQERGLEYLTEDYSAAGKLTAKREVTFGNDRPGLNDSICIVSASSISVPGKYNPYSYCGTAYTIRTHMMRPEKIMETMYDDNGRESVTTTDIDYGLFLLPDAMTVSNGGARKFRTVFSRPYHNDFAAGSGLNEVAAKMISQHRYSPVLQTVKYTIIGGKSYETERSVQKYADKNSVLPLTTEVSIGGKEAAPGVSYIYDSTNNVIVEKYPDGTSVGLVWAPLYPTSHYHALIATIEGDDSDGGIEALVRKVMKNGVANSAMYQSLRQCQNVEAGNGYLVTILNYDGYGMVSSVESATGNITNFGYDCLGRLVRIGDRFDRVAKLFNYNFSR
ncbi:hypothetical protein ED551_09810 [Muribaculaceae bacterium Isolate-013 (NCI)]|nr:hypothetical protein ED551_09810 [Muribaculaceae bacterium Isolate-013 (NCI)]